MKLPCSWLPMLFLPAFFVFCNRCVFLAACWDVFSRSLYERAFKKKTLLWVLWDYSQVDFNQFMFLVACCFHVKRTLDVVEREKSLIWLEESSNKLSKFRDHDILDTPSNISKECRKKFSAIWVLWHVMANKRNKTRQKRSFVEIEERTPLTVTSTTKTNKHYFSLKQ